MLRTSGKNHVTVQVDNEKICVDLTRDNQKAAELDVRADNCVSLSSLP